jgi:hypothetical protein
VASEAPLERKYSRCASFFMKSGLLIFLISIGLVSCKTTDFVGLYELSFSHKNSIELKKDGTFKFIELIPGYSNGYDGNCYITNGTWTVMKNRLTLNSSKDSTRIKNAEIIEIKEDQTKVDTGLWVGKRFPLSHSTFTFYDIQGDTVDILSGNSPNGSSIYKLHRSMRFLYWPTLPDISNYSYTLSDTMEFHLNGYRPFKYIRSDRVRRIVKVKLYPDIVNGDFTNKKYVINRKRIKDDKFRFVKKTNAQQNVSSMVR